jgi:hypothetical protein
MMLETRSLMGTMVLALGVLASGCSRDTLQSGLDSYLRALSELSPERLAQRAQGPELEPYPRRGEIRIEIPDLRLGLLEFLSLDRHCGIGTLVAGRNSAMGKVLPDSQRLVYEQTLLGRLRDCRDRFSGEEEVAWVVELGELLERKSRELPPAFWNATFAGPEFEKLFSLSGGGPVDPTALGDVGATTLEALDYLTRSFDNLRVGALPLDASALEDHLHNLAIERYGGRLLSSAAALVPVLEIAAQHLRNIPHDDADCVALRSLHRDQVTGWLRPYLSNFDAAAEDFFHRVHRLLDLASVGPDQTPLAAVAPPFSTYHEQFLRVSPPTGLWLRLASAKQQHADAWAEVSATCGS